MPCRNVYYGVVSFAPGFGRGSSDGASAASLQTTLYNFALTISRT